MREIRAASASLANQYLPLLHLWKNTLEAAMSSVLLFPTFGSSPQSSSSGDAVYACVNTMTTTDCSNLIAMNPLQQESRHQTLRKVDLEEAARNLQQLIDKVDHTINIKCARLLRSSQTDA